MLSEVWEGFKTVLFSARNCLPIWLEFQDLILNINHLYGVEKTDKSSEKTDRTEALSSYTDGTQMNDHILFLRRKKSTLSILMQLVPAFRHS